VRARLSLLAVVVSTLGSLPSVAQQVVQPQFMSGGIQVVVNRAVRPAPGQQLVMSLILVNLWNDDVALVAPELPMIITEGGGVATARQISGIPVSPCGADARRCIQTGSLTPTVIDRGNSITVTLVFSANPNSKACNLDLSMPLVIQRASTSSAWRQIGVGLPNIRVC